MARSETEHIRSASPIANKVALLRIIYAGRRVSVGTACPVKSPWQSKNTILTKPELRFLGKCFASGVVTLSA
jgi:hypothetical protein